jgi:hypothetical protein
VYVRACVNGALFWLDWFLAPGKRTHDAQDGTQLQFKSVPWGVYFAAELGGGTVVVANRTQASGWETFKVGLIILQRSVLASD